MAKRKSRGEGEGGGATVRSQVPALDAYLTRIGAEELNFRRFMVKEHRKGSHYYVEKTLIKIGPDGAISCSRRDHDPTAEEAKAIREGIAKIEFPKSILAEPREAEKQADAISAGAEYVHLFFERREGKVVMLQQMFRDEAGGKVYVPWTKWSDGEWRRMEPEGDLPFWKPPKRRRKLDASPARIMVHEGSKTAAFVDDLLHNPARRDEARAHPWHDELIQYEHWGMIGGALSPHRADYGELHRERPVRCVYVCDNDFSGEAALQVVSKCYGESLIGVRFGKEFRESWDMADPIPDHLFAGKGKARRYHGRPLRNYMQPATWATEMVPVPGSKRPVAVMRRAFLEEWTHSIRPEVYIHRDWAYDMWTAQEFNNKVRPFSHVDDTARLIKAEDASKAAIIRYDPARLPGFYEEKGRFINTHLPCDVVAERGDPGPFVEFIDRLVEVEEDRHELLRWCATLIARPDIKMTYGVLLISETQGVGKSTLGEKILAPLVGDFNVSYPSETEIVDSNYNYWLAHRRLAVVHEIYAGHSSKAYHRLQSVVTDKFITVSKKYMANYEIENWMHVYACSNSMRALRLSMEDRRWYLPKITEKKQPAEYWLRLNGWLRHEGGLGKIKQWAIDFLKINAPVMTGEEAPWSSVKRDVVEDGYSPGQRLAATTLSRIESVLTGTEREDEAMRQDWMTRGMLHDGAVAVLDVDLVRLIGDVVYGGRQNDKLEKPLTVRKLAKSVGWHVGVTPVSTGMRAWGPAACTGRVISNRPEVAATPPSELGGRTGEKNGRTPMRPLDLNFAREM